MAERDDWYPARRDKQRAMYANVLAKIGNYKNVIDGLTDARIERIKLMCQMYIAVYDWLAQSEARLAGGYEFQKDLEKGNLSETVNAPPAFETLVLPAGAFKGFVTEFRKEIGLLKKQNGYTAAIGEDLMIVREQGEAISPEQRQPAFKYEMRQGFRLLVSGSMQGMRAANFYYRRKGQTEWMFVGYLTRTPGEIHIPPAQTGQPEAGEIKSIFSENNEEVGQFSTNTEVTLS
jgi:hypothetical protein